MTDKQQTIFQSDYIPRIDSKNRLTCLSCPLPECAYMVNNSAIRLACSVYNRRIEHQKRPVRLKVKLMTETQQAILEFIRTCDDEGEPPPTIREIMDVLGISSTSVVNYNLEALERDGHITRNRTVSRGIRLAGKPSGKLVELAEALRVVQVQIADLQAEMKRLRQMVKQPAPSEADDPWKSPEGDWQAMNRAARQ